jgi:tRNA A-37 threonylcarbamoyl transferase component Bud32
MSTVLTRIEDAVADLGLRVTKAVPRRPDHLLLELAAPDGSPVAAQWFADRERATQVARQTESRTGHDVRVPVLSSTGVLVQRAGVDRRLPVLHRLAARPDAVIVAHRPERRGVVRRVDGKDRETYTKVVRPDRMRRTLAGARTHIDGVALPPVTATDRAAGTLTCRALPGTSLHDLLADRATDDEGIRQVGLAVGEAVARLHETDPPPTVDQRHDAHTEAEVTHGWLAQATAWGLLDPQAPVAEAVLRLEGFVGQPPCRPTYLHRDLHDKQLVVDDGLTVGMLDFDLAAIGEPALDLANLLVHLELRALQRRCSPARAAACAEALVEGYAPTPDVWSRVPCYALTTRLRLAAVYAFRPGGSKTGMALLTEGSPGPLHDIRYTRERR